jgi:hypothetical protein
MLRQVEIPLIQQLLKLYRLSVPRSHGMNGIHGLYELGEDSRWNINSAIALYGQIEVLTESRRSIKARKHASGY